MSDEKRGYALKAERGERPFIYSQEHADWQKAVQRRDERGTADSARQWARRFNMHPKVRAANGVEV